MGSENVGHTGRGTAAELYTHTTHDDSKTLGVFVDLADCVLESAHHSCGECVVLLWVLNLDHEDTRDTCVHVQVHVPTVVDVRKHLAPLCEEEHSRVSRPVLLRLCLRLMFLADLLQNLPVLGLHL